MKKKLLSISLLCLVGMILAGCGGSKSSNTQAPASSSGEPSSVVPSSSSETPVPSSSSEVPSSTSVAPSSSSSAPSSSSSSVAPQPVAVTGVALDKTQADVVLGQTLQLVATVAPENADNKEVTWSSSDEDVASVSKQGLVTANGIGEAKITVKTREGNFKAECVVTVIKQINAVTIDNKAAFEATLYTNQTRELEISVDPADNVANLISTGALKITSSDEAIATVNGRNITGVAEGTATITVSLWGKTDSVSVNVGGKVPAPEKVNAKPSEVMAADDTNGKVIYHVEGYVINWGTKTEWTQYGEMTVGDAEDSTEGMYVYGSYVEGVTFEWNDVDHYSFKYTSRDVLTNELTKNLHIGDKVTMDVIRTDYQTTKEVKGQILAVEPGKFVAATGVEVKLNGSACSELSLRAGENKLLKSVIAPADATENPVWSSSNEEVATVKDGFVKALKAGTATIKVKVNATVEAEVALTVSEALTVAHAGTQADPYTVDEAVAVVGGLDLRAFTENDIFVKGVVLTSSYSTQYANYTIWLADSNNAKAFEIYAGVFAEAAGLTAEQLAAFQKTDGLKGYEILVSGKGQFYDNTLEITRVKQEDGSYIYPQMLSATKATAEPTAIAAQDMQLALGAEGQIEVTFTPFYASAALTYVSSNTAVATVDENGKVTAAGPGEATITISVSETVKAEIKVTVKDKDPLTETVALDFTNRTETGGIELKLDDSNKASLGGDTVLEFFQKAGEKGAHVTSIAKSSKVYSGSGTGGAFPNSKGLIKFGSSSAAGELHLVLDGKANKVVVKAQSFNDNNTANLINVVGSVEGPTLVNQAAAINSGADIVFNLKEATDTIKLITSIKFRVLVYAITISYEEPQAAHEHAWVDADPVVGAEGKVSYSKQTCGTDAVKLTIAAKDANAVISGATSSTPEGSIKFSKEENPGASTPTQGSATYTFDYSGSLLKGKLYQVGYMDNWKNSTANEKKSYFDSIKVSDSQASFKVTVNGNAVNITNGTLFGDMPGNDGTPVQDSWSPALTCLVGEIELKNGENTIVYMRKGSYNLAYKELVLVLDEKVVEQPKGTFFSAVEVTDAGKTALQAAGSIVPVFINLGAENAVSVSVNGASAGASVIKSYDKSTGDLVITTTNFGDLSMTYNPEAGTLDKLSVVANKGILKYDGGQSLRGNDKLKYWNCDGTTEELQAEWNRRYGDPWTLDNNNADKVTQNTEHAISGSAMRLRPYADNRFALATKDFAQPFNARNISFWVYNSGSADATIQCFAYKSTGYTNFIQPFGNKTIPAGQWTFISAGFTATDLYGFQIFVAKTASALIFDDICLY